MTISRDSSINVVSVSVFLLSHKTCVDNFPFPKDRQGHC